MSLCGPAVASGLTARPPGHKKRPPSTMESPMEEKRVDSSSTKELILGILLAAPVTNDRCTNHDEAKCYELLQALLMEEARCTHNKNASQGPLDWRLIHGDDYKSPEPPATGHTNDNDDNDDDILYNNQVWEDDWEDDSSWLSWSSSILDCYDANDNDKEAAGEFYDEIVDTPMVTTTKKVLCHYEEVKRLFVDRLLGIGTFRWPSFHLWMTSVSPGHDSYNDRDDCCTTHPGHSNR